MSRQTGVPLCDVQLQYRCLETEIQQAVQRVLSSGQVILGPEVAKLEQEIADYCGTNFAVGCASGTDALLLALQALGIGAGDEVIVPTFTFFASAATVCRTGARPVFVDIDSATYNLDPAAVARAITPHTRAVMPVHLFGQTADMDIIGQLARQHQLAVIEDAAQAIGAEFQKQRAGSLGATGCFSFYPSKNLGGLGDGGMVVTSDRTLAEHMAALRIHGMKVRYHHQYLGWNSRLDALQAAILRVKLRHLEEWTMARQGAAQRYDALLEEYSISDVLHRPFRAPQRRHVFNQYVVRVGGGLRDSLVRHLQQNHIGCEVYYPVPLHLQECLAFLGHGPGDFPVSEEACRTVLALPMFPEITEEQQQRVIECCAAFLRQPITRAA